MLGKNSFIPPELIVAVTALPLCSRSPSFFKCTNVAENNIVSFIEFRDPSFKKETLLKQARDIHITPQYSHYTDYSSPCLSVWSTLTSDMKNSQSTDKTCKQWQNRKSMEQLVTFDTCSASVSHNVHGSEHVGKAKQIYFVRHFQRHGPTEKGLSGQTSAYGAWMICMTTSSISGFLTWTWFISASSVCCFLLLTIEGLSLAPRGKHVDTYRKLRRGSNVLAQPADTK